MASVEKNLATADIVVRLLFAPDGTMKAVDVDARKALTSKKRNPVTASKIIPDLFYVLPRCS